MASNAVDTSRISSVVGYKIVKGNFNETTPNLPQRIAIFGEANTANQSGLSTDPIEVTSAQQAGQLFGFGSPIYLAMRILRPINGGGVQGIPTIVYPQASSGATSKIMTITPTGVASGNGTHTIVIGGRDGLDGEFYNINILAGDTTAEITQKIEDAVNNVLGAPVIASNDSYETTLESKWQGLTAQGLTVSIDDNGNDLDLSYAISTTQAATGTPSISASLDLIGAEWVTILVNTYGTNSTVMTTLENFNGIPDATTPTGRYAATVTKPFIALTGSVADNESSLTDTKKDQVTIAICPAPLSAGFQFEAASNMAVLFSRQAQDAPHLDVSNLNYPDMPTPDSIGTMAIYDNRDSYVKKGCSTVDLVAGKYKVMDFVTTYHPVGEVPAQFRYCRNLMIDFNVRFGYYLAEEINVVGHAIAGNNDIVSASMVVTPNIWKAVLAGYAKDLANRALIADPAFMIQSLNVNLSTSNPDRLETNFRYKRLGFARIASTTAEAGFNLGSL